MILAVLLVLLTACTPVSEEPARWTDAAQLQVARTYGQAALLPGGRILLEGGLDRGSASPVRSESEVFDPLTGTSRLIAAPEGGRLWQTLTALADDRILSVGGTSRGERNWLALATASLFDPVTLRYVPVPQPTFARSDHGATLLRDGRVLVAGGHDGPKFVRQVEIFDPVTGRWSLTYPLPAGRSQFSIATLPDGRVLLAGGFIEPGDPTDTSVIYDPELESWTAGPRLSAARAIHATVQLPRGDVLLIGGQRGGAGTAERYVAARNEFVFAGTLVNPRMFAAAALDERGGVLLVGGFLRPESGEGFIPTARAERWDPLTNLWTEVAPARVPRAASGAVFSAGGLWLLGGSAEGDEALSSTELYR